MVRERPVTHKEFIAVLKHIGFTERPQDGSSHVNWVRRDTDGFKKVTVDRNNAPYHRKMLKNMLNQAGLSKNKFFDLLDEI